MSCCTSTTRQLCVNEWKRVTQHSTAGKMQPRCSRNELTTAPRPAKTSPAGKPRPIRNFRLSTPSLTRCSTTTSSARQQFPQYGPLAGDSAIPGPTGSFAPSHPRHTPPATIPTTPERPRLCSRRPLQHHHLDLGRSEPQTLSSPPIYLV